MSKNRGHAVRPQRLAPGLQCQRVEKGPLALGNTDSTLSDLLAGSVKFEKFEALPKPCFQRPAPKPGMSGLKGCAALFSKGIPLVRMTGVEFDGYDFDAIRIGSAGRRQCG